MLTSALRYSFFWLEFMSFSRHSMAIMGLFSTSSGSFCGVRPQWYTSRASFSSSCSTCVGEGVCVCVCVCVCGHRAAGGGGA
jgi:hypothetical protein